MDFPWIQQPVQVQAPEDIKARMRHVTAHHVALVSRSRTRTKSPRITAMISTHEESLLDTESSAIRHLDYAMVCHASRLEKEGCIPSMTKVEHLVHPRLLAQIEQDFEEKIKFWAARLISDLRKLRPQIHDNSRAHQVVKATPTTTSGQQNVAAATQSPLECLPHETIYGILCEFRSPADLVAMISASPKYLYVYQDPRKSLHVIFRLSCAPLTKLAFKRRVSGACRSRPPRYA